MVSCMPLWVTKKDVQDIQASAHRSDARARVLLGELYEFGAGVSQNHLIAAQWYQLAAKQNNADAQLYLGVLYDRGDVLRRNPDKSLNWLFQSAEQGNEKAMTLLAAIYLKDKSRRQAFAKRIRQYRQSAERGNANSQYMMGRIYAEGVGVPVNAAEAKNWYRKAARQRNSKAAFALGNSYLADKASPANLRAAMEMYAQSAQKDIKAQVKLFSLYKSGGPAENPKEAKKWLEAATRNTPPSLRVDIDRQHRILQSEKRWNPELALRACRRLSEIDPGYEEVSGACDALDKRIGDKLASEFKQAQDAIEKKDWDSFGNLLASFISSDFDDRTLRALIASAWIFIDEENRATEKIAARRLQFLETAQRSDAFRKKNISRIPAYINAFKKAVAPALREHPADEGLLSLAARGRRVIAGLERKLKAPPPPPPPPPAQEDTLTDLPEDPPEEIEPGDDDFKQAQSLFDSGQFEEAAILFEKTTKVRGFKNIASAYIYLGISHLARIDPANITEARTFHLKGMASFQNALRFDNEISLPEGYDKYQPVFEEAKEGLR